MENYISTLEASRYTRLKLSLKQIYRNKFLYMLLLPGLLYFIIYRYLPMAGLVIAFKDFNFSQGIFGSPWIGIRNFKFIFTQNYAFYSLLANTLLINFYKLIFGFPVPIIIALMLNEIRNARLKKFMQSSVYLPYFVSWVIFGGIVMQLLSPTDGIVNEAIKLFGGQPIFFMTDPKWFRSTIVFSDIWKTAGWNSILYLAAITGVDETLYDAAYIDGANKLQLIWHVTLPGISDTIAVLLLLNIGVILNVGFEQMYVMYSPAVYNVGDILSTYVYRVGIGQARFSMATAIGLFQSFIGFVLICTSNFILKRTTGKSLW
jgi:putative aldouronate transport system permease protein